MDSRLNRSFKMPAICLGLLVSTTAMAGSWNFSVDLDSMKINSDAAEREYIDDKATVLGFAAEYDTGKNGIVVGGGFDLISYDDNAGFDQNTNRGNKSSNASGSLLYVEAGPTLHFGTEAKAFFDARLGYSHMMQSERSIDYCSNCYSEDINIDGGAYGTLAIGRLLGDHFALSLEYQQFFSGDLDNSLGLKFGYHY
jgi:hypothetical protein